MHRHPTQHNANMQDQGTSISEEIPSYLLSPTLHLSYPPQDVSFHTEDWVSKQNFGDVVPDAIENISKDQSFHKEQSFHSEPIDTWPGRNPKEQGYWEENPTNDTGAGNSDFLVFEPPPPNGAPGYQEAVTFFQNEIDIDSAQNAFENSQPPPAAVMNASHHPHLQFPEDAQIAKAVNIAMQIEELYHSQNLDIPVERTPETIEIIRNLALQIAPNELTQDSFAKVAENEKIISLVVDEVLGAGPLEPLLRDDSVSEIMVIGPHMTYVEQGGSLYEVPVHFLDESHLMHVLYKLINPSGGTLSRQNPIFDGQLSDGSRINVVIPPNAVSGPTLTIRRPIKRMFALEQLVRNDMMSLHIADFLKECVADNVNIIISGSPGSGKTTLLNALANSIDENDRIVIIEELAELQLRQRHAARFEAPSVRPPGFTGAYITTGELIYNTLRLSPQRIILGELRPIDAFGFIQALHCGHNGSMTTLQAHSIQDALNRLESLVSASAGSTTPNAIRRQIASGVDVIVQCARLRDGSRRIISITEVVGADDSSIEAHELFTFREMGFDLNTGRIKGDFAATNIKPTFRQSNF